MKLSYISLIRMPTDRAHGYAVMKMCEQFAKTGVEVELTVPRRRYGINKDPFDYYHIERIFTLTKLWATDLLGRIEGSRLAFALDQASFLQSVLVHRYAETVVYTRDYQVALLARAKRIVLEVHTIPERKILFLRAVGRSHKVIVISGGLRDALVAHGVPISKILVAPDAVDLSEYKITPSRDIWREYGVDPGKKIALYTGHFYGWKGVDTFAESAAFLPKDIQVILMGGADRELDDLKKRFASEQIHVIEFQPREKLAALLMTADVLVLPNSARPKISSHYTSPLKLFQYMAAGVPIIASDLPSIREILTNETSYWFTPDDPKALATQIEHVLSNTTDAHSKAAHAKKEVQKYTWYTRAKAILDFIRG